MSTNLPQPEGNFVITGRRPPAGCVQMSTLSSAIALSSIPEKARLVYIQAETQSIRWRDDGTSPTASVGNLIQAGDTIEYDGDISQVKIIETTTSAKANLAYYY